MPRKFNITAIDTVLVNTASLYSDPALDSELAEASSFCVHTIVDQVSANASLIVELEHSNDRRNWHFAAGTGAPFAITAGAVTNNIFAAADTTALMAFVRVRLSFSINTSARIQVFVTGHDR